MKYYSRGLGLVVLIFLTLIMFSSAPQKSTEKTVGLGTPATNLVAEIYPQLPLSFEANQGQTDEQVRFLSKGRGYNLYLTPTEAVLSLRQPAESDGQDGEERRATLSMLIVGANPSPLIEGVEELPGKSNYFIGNDPSKWRTNVPTYAKVHYRDVYPGVDCIYYGKEDQLEFDFVLAAGADPNSIVLSFDGTSEIEIDSEGALVLMVAGEEIRLQEPDIFQEVDGVDREIAGAYQLLSSHEVGFDIGVYDPDRALRIDPVLSYATYLGGSDREFGYGVAVDAGGNAYVVGNTNSPDFPTANAYQALIDNSNDAFITKFNAAGTALIYSTYLGGNAPEYCLDIALDASGSAYVVGNTWSTNFPTKSAIQPAMGGYYDAFVTKLDPTGSALVFSTFFGGSDSDSAQCVALGASGSIFFAGLTDSTDFPTKNPFQASLRDYDDGFVTKFNAAGSAVEYSTYLGGEEGDRCEGIAVYQDHALVTGYTDSENFPTKNSLQPILGGDDDAFVTKLDTTGSALVYSTYLGGQLTEYGIDIAVDSSGNAYIAGSTHSSDFPTQDPIQALYGGGGLDGYVTKINAAGSALVYSTYLGGNDTDYAVGIALDSSANAYVAGYTYSGDFPTQDPIQASYAGAVDPIVFKINTAGSALVYSTYYGGSSYDNAYAIAVDATNSAYIVGTSQSNDFPVSAGAFQTDHAGSNDVILVKIAGSQMSYLPQVVAGGDYATIFTWMNTGATTANGNLIISDQNGDPFSVLLAEASTDSRSAGTGEPRAAQGSTFPFSIAPGATAFMTATAPNPSDPPKSGWARVEYTGGSLGGVGTFQLMQGSVLQTVAGVLASQPLQAATIPVDNDDSEARYTGFAAANHGSQDINIDLVTLDETGTVEETISPPELNPLGPQRQIARFLHQYGTKYNTFKGSMVVKGGATDAFVLTALVQNQGMLTAIPVMPGKADSVVAEGELPLSSESSFKPRELTEEVSCYPQLVVGGNFSTDITGANTGDTNVEGELILTGQGGEAFPVVLDGLPMVGEPGGVRAAQGSNFPIQIAPGATMFLKATALNPSDPATSGWARIVYAGGILGGVSTFQLMQGGALQTIAGVLASDPLTAATIPVGNNDPLARYTGFAVANLKGEAINIRIVILNEDGTIEETLTPLELNPLAGYCQIAKFLHQYGTKYNTFKGSMVLIAEGGKTFIVTALVLNQGLYTAIPVIPGKAPFIQ